MARAIEVPRRRDDALLHRERLQRQHPVGLEHWREGSGLPLRGDFEKPCRSARDALQVHQFTEKWLDRRTLGLAMSGPGVQTRGRAGRDMRRSVAALSLMQVGDDRALMAMPVGPGQHMGSTPGLVDEAAPRMALGLIEGQRAYRTLRKPHQRVR